MHILNRMIALGRSHQLQRQFQEIERRIRALPGRGRARLGLLTLREIGQASQCEFPHLYGTPPEDRYLPWGQGIATGYARARSDNAEVSLRGIALWLAVAYHETKDSPHAGVQTRHRQVLRVLRELKGAQAGTDSPQDWAKAEAVA